MVSRLGEGVREELKRALYGTASVSGSITGCLAATAGLSGKFALWRLSVVIAAGAARATAVLPECPLHL